MGSGSRWWLTAAVTVATLWSPQRRAAAQVSAADAAPSAAAVDQAGGSPAGKAFNVQTGFRLGWTKLRDDQGLEIAGGPGMVWDLSWRPLPFLSVGGEVGYFRYGWTRHQERYRLVDPGGAETPLFLRYQRKTDLVPMLLAARLQTPWGRVRPYLQALGGLTIFKTIVDLENIEGDEDDIIDSFAPVALAGGAELGVDIVLVRQRYSAPDHDASLLLSIGVRRLWNSSARFGLPGPLAAGTRQSASTLHMLTVGISGRAAPGSQSHLRRAQPGQNVGDALGTALSAQRE